MTENFFDLVIATNAKYLLAVNAMAYSGNVSIMPLNEFADIFCCLCGHDGITSI